MEALILSSPSHGRSGERVLVWSCLRSDSAIGFAVWAPDPGRQGTGFPDTIWVGLGWVLP